MKDTTLNADRLGLDAGARVLTNRYLNAENRGNVALTDIAKAYGDSCDVVIVAVPRGEGTIFETRLWHEFNAGEGES